MNLKLTRKSSGLYGIFGEIHTEMGEQIAVTLEHAYRGGASGGWVPKLPVGMYTCKRGTHQPNPAKPAFETFEILNVPGHTGILFHKGNFNDDSEGCVLVGSELGQICILESEIAFGKFMQIQTGVDQYTLIVE